MKKFTIMCDVGGQMTPFVIYIGEPERMHHPIHFQAKWFSDTKGGVIPIEVMNALSQMQELAIKNNASLEGLCVYALGASSEDDNVEMDMDENNENNAINN